MAALQRGSVRSRLVGASTRRRMQAASPLPGRSNYFVGNQAFAWLTDIPTYREVRNREVYPGIDLVYYGQQGQLEYDFVVAPGGDAVAAMAAVVEPAAG